MSTMQLILILLSVYNMAALIGGISSEKPAVHTDTIPGNTNRPGLRGKSSLATAVVNTQVLTIFNYRGGQVYVYSSMSNENENARTPQKWIFYFVPIMMPVVTGSSSNDWVSAVNSEIRVRLMLSDENAEETARRAIVRKNDSSISQYSNFWDVVPLMIDSLMAYIVRGTNLPVGGVHPFKAIHPNELTITCRFQCSSSENAAEIVQKIIAGDYEIELAFHFAGFKQVTTNLISITSDQLRNVLSKTIADGGNRNAQYIHRNQESTFLSTYVANVKRMIYMENVNTNTSLLSSGIEDQFISLLQQGMAYSDTTKLAARFYDQVWSSSDLNPDLITNEVSKLFTYNQSETQRNNYSDTFFNFNEAYARSWSASAKAKGSFLKIGSFGVSGNAASSSSGEQSTTTKAIYSANEIQNWLTQQSIETEWTGQKFIPKSFNVYKLNDIADRLQVAIVAKQLIAESANGAIVRTVKTTSKSISSSTTNSDSLLGEIKLYSGNASSLPPSWVFCHGQVISRAEYRRLFSVIGESYGAGDRQTTFNVPDFRGRFPLGLDSRKGETVGIRQNGAPTCTLAVDNLPSHSHNQGSFATNEAGIHGHNVHDPGHNHGGSTGEGSFSSGPHAMNRGGGAGNDHGRHTHSIPAGSTGVSLHHNGNHRHSIEGQSGTVGSNTAFSIMPPSQTIDFIIFAG